MPRVTSFVFNVYDWITDHLKVMTDLQHRINLALADPPTTTGCVLIALNTHMSGEETLPKWIRFEQIASEPTRKTKIWKVISVGVVGVLLGEIRWYGPWRKYSYYPNQGLAIVLEPTCLRDIAQFCQDMTEFRKKERKA